MGAWKGKGLVQSTAAPKGEVKTAGLLLKEEEARFVCISPPMLSGGKTFCFSRVRTVRTARPKGGKVFGKEHPSISLFQ